ncbi:MAG: iron-sulfur cluster repair di-iron protein [Cyanobacteria bacterium TGS_CYA1]|nr:iron-sulfur cluster repair di-iron protein [Cyanobacteria bacterium TGS_CYA1]
MNILDTDLVADIVRDHPSSAGIFEAYGIDFCCGGKITLKEACSKNGILIKKIINELRIAKDTDAPDKRDWAKSSVSELVDNIVLVHHKFLERELPRLSNLCQKVSDVHGEKHSELKELSSVFAHLKAELEQHLMKEEKILFPMCKEMEISEAIPAFHCGSISNPIAVMEKEHDEAGNALSRIKVLTKNYAIPDDACPSYSSLLQGLKELEMDLHIHIHKENNILFPKIKSREQILTAKL